MAVTRTQEAARHRVPITPTAGRTGQFTGALLGPADVAGPGSGHRRGAPDGPGRRPGA